MDPVSAAAATGATKGAGSVVGKQLLRLLGKRTFRLRVARAVSKAAKADGIAVGRRSVAKWLKHDECRAAVASGESIAVDQALVSYHLDYEAPGFNADKVAARLVVHIRDESLRRMPQGDAFVTQTRRLEDAIAAKPEPRALLTSGGDEIAFSHALEKLHPWRAETARQIAEGCPEMRALIITLAGERDRKDLLRQWGIAPPAGLVGAPGEAWCWFACVATDYGANEAVLAFISKGVDAGASASYWWARAGLTVGTGSSEDAKRARELWALSVPKHPLAAAGEAIVDEQYAVAESFLNGWDADTPNDQSIKSILQTAAATGRGDFNRAIAIGVAASAAHPEGSGNTLRTAEALLSRGHYGPSDHPLDDFARAYDLAIQARDSRRTWLGDSVAPTLTAVKAAVLATDVDQAWRLTQTAPEGSALHHEARDGRLRRESAVLAATMGRFENAQRIADELDDPFVASTVEGWKAFAEDRPDDAEEAWLRAWDLAPDDTARLQTAAALAPLGRGLPDLDSLPDEVSLAVAQIRTTHEVMSSDEDMTLLRVRAADSEQLTVLLAERLFASGQVEEAAAALEAGGVRWSHPLLMRMAASRYESAGNYEKAFEVGAMALSLGGPGWAGRLETLMVQFNALESMGEFSRSLAVSREMITLAPANLTIRWALVHGLVRAGNIQDAWAALSYQGQLVEPRDPSDARTWIGLAAECDSSSEFVQRSLAVMVAWLHEPDLVAVFLIQIYRGLSRHERDVADTDIQVLHQATEDFAEAHPENQVFRRFTLDEDDPLGSLTALLQDQALEPPEIADVRQRIESGDLPLGFLSELAGRTYVEACIKTAAGLVYSHLPSMAAAGEAAATAALDSRVVIDASAAVTLALLDPAVADRLVGAFLALETTDSAFRDALSAQQSLSMMSTMSLAWDASNNRPQVTEINAEQAQAFVERADRVVGLLTRSERRGWPGLTRFAGLAGDGVWLSALDMAMSEGRPLWCDDRALRQLAAAEGSQTFGTGDLLASLESQGRLDPVLASAVRAQLICNYHVDLDFDLSVMELAAEQDGWMPKGSAATLARAHSWRDPQACIRFASRAMVEVAPQSPIAVAHWTAAAGLGLVRITDGDSQGAAGNLEILLNHLLAQPWLRPDTLPYVMQGIRTAVAELPETLDPLPAVLAQIYAQISERHGAPQAAEFLLLLVAQLGDADRMAAARVILTARD